MPMIAAALALLVPLQGEVGSYDLFRGAPLPNREIGYWGVTDTFLDSQQADVNFGGNGTLLGGPGKVILVKFDDLRRAVGDNKVVKASLVLSPSGGQIPEFRSISKVLAPWGEGPVNTLASVLAANQAKLQKDPPKVEPPRWSATWQARRAGSPNGNWQSPGASGQGDAERIADATFTPGETTVRIDGLADAVQQMIDRPYDNHGFALTFANACEFFSSQSPIGRPMLEVTIAGAEPKTGADLSVISIERSTATGALPKDGDEAVYTATVKNVGDAAASGFTSSWYTEERRGATLDHPEAIAPGATARLTLRRAYKFNPTDHRLQPIGLRITPKGSDASAANNYLEVQESAVPILVEAPAGQEDRIQEHVRFFNEVLAPQSRYSFAREGALERIAVQGFEQPGAATTSGLGRAKLAGTLDGQIDMAFLRELGKAAGLVDLSLTQFPAGQRNEFVNRGALDIAPGIMGYGDTRFEGAISAFNALPYEPFSSPLLDIQPLEATGLLSATDVAILNHGLARTKSAEDVLNSMPRTVLLRALDIAGRPLGGMELSFFQSKDGKFVEEPPAFTVVADARGSVILPVQETGPFGKVTADGGNGVFLVRASANGVTEWGWLKAWQLVDSLNRGGTDATMFEMRFNLPGAPLDGGTDLANNRIVTDSTGATAARLAGLVDGDFSQPVDLGGKGSWVEIDLGRDRTLGEIDIVGMPDEMWRKFDVVVYATGQSASGAVPWAKEVDFRWTAANRRDPVAGATSVAYRGLPLRVRFIRIINKTDEPGKLRGIRVVPARS